MTETFAAVDLGATSGRVITGRVGADELDLADVHRFANVPVPLPDGLHWDVLGLYRQVLEGLRAAAEHDPVSVGVDSWAVDFGLLDGDGVLLGNPHHYRDPRAARAMPEVSARVGDEELYRISGLQQLPINTVYQLVASRGSSVLDSARTLLMLPDLLVYWLTGDVGAERTNASTTGLFDARQRCWSTELMQRLGLPAGLFPPLREPGSAAGSLRREVAGGWDVPELAVTRVASHDTASAVAAVPAAGRRFAFVSCGTWSLAGVELDSPVLTEDSRRAGFTNELGVDGTVRYLRNLTGLWLLEECLRSWRYRGDRSQLLLEAGEQEPFAAVVDVADEGFLAPPDMPAAIAEHCRRTGQTPPGTPAATVRCILESLALAHRTTVRTAAELSGHAVDVVHVVGGGSQNELLCQLTADACGLPVVAGPTEATALGNILVQARSRGIVENRHAGRRLVAATQPLRHYEPRGRERAWAAAAERLA
jgi:rhamnulokinase